MTRKQRLPVAMILALLAIMPWTAHASNTYSPSYYQGVPDSRFVIPGNQQPSVPTGGNTYSPSYYQGVPDSRFVIPGNQQPSGTTGGNTYSPSSYQGVPDSRFVIPGGQQPSGTTGGNTYATPYGQGQPDSRFITSGSQNAAQSSGGPRITGEAKIVNCKEWVNVRSDPSTRSKPVGKAYLGATLNVLQWDSTGTWAYARYNSQGDTGWISGQFIRR